MLSGRVAYAYKWFSRQERRVKCDRACHETLNGQLRYNVGCSTPEDEQFLTGLASHDLPIPAKSLAPLIASLLFFR